MIKLLVTLNVCYSLDYSDAEYSLVSLECHAIKYFKVLVQIYPRAIGARFFMVPIKQHPQANLALNMALSLRDQLIINAYVAVRRPSYYDLLTFIFKVAIVWSTATITYNISPEEGPPKIFNFSLVYSAL